MLKQDVDEASLKRADEALSRERSRLDTLVEERDADMTRRAKLNAKTSSRMLDTFPSKYDGL